MTLIAADAAHCLVIIIFFFFFFFSFFYIHQAIRFARLTGPSRLNRAIHRKLYTTI